MNTDGVKLLMYALLIGIVISVVAVWTVQRGSYQPENDDTQTTSATAKGRNAVVRDPMKKRSPWLYTGLTNVIYRPVLDVVYHSQPGLTVSELKGLTNCNVTVPLGVVTNRALREVYTTITTAVARANTMLVNKNYTVWQYNGSTTMYSIDKTLNGVWYIVSANNRVLTIGFEKYDDDKLTLRNLSEGYEVHFLMDGSFNFFWSLDCLHSLRYGHAEWAEPPFDITWTVPASSNRAKETRFNKEGTVVGEREVPMVTAQMP